MSNIYIGTETGSNGDGNFIDVTVTNASGGAWTNPIVSVIAKVGGATASYYTAYTATASIGITGSIDIGPIGIGSNTYVSASGDYVHAGVAFTGTAITI